MESNVYMTSLFDIYGKLLTEKQQLYFINYYFNDYSLKEISENYEISRNAVHKAIKDVEEKLHHYETVLQLCEKRNQIKNLDIDKEVLNKILDII